MQTKTCSVCKLEKGLTEFYKNKGKGDGYQHLCKPCRADYSRWHYQQNKQYYLDKVSRRKELSIEYWREYKSKLQCKNCGFSNPLALDYHHRDPKAKEFTISHAISQGVGREKIQAEIDKCDVLCANCHRIEHGDSYSV